MSAQTDADIVKCITDIKDICLVMTDPKEWQRRRDERNSQVHPVLRGIVNGIGGGY